MSASNSTLGGGSKLSGSLASRIAEARQQYRKQFGEAPTAPVTDPPPSEKNAAKPGSTTTNGGGTTIDPNATTTRDTADTDDAFGAESTPTRSTKGDTSPNEELQNRISRAERRFEQQFGENPTAPPVAFETGAADALGVDIRKFERGQGIESGAGRVAQKAQELESRLLEQSGDDTTASDVRVSKEGNELVAGLTRDAVQKRAQQALEATPTIAEQARQEVKTRFPFATEEDFSVNVEGGGATVTYTPEFREQISQRAGYNPFTPAKATLAQQLEQSVGGDTNVQPGDVEIADGTVSLSDEFRRQQAAQQFESILSGPDINTSPAGGRLVKGFGTSPGDGTMANVKPSDVELADGSASLTESFRQELAARRLERRVEAQLGRDVQHDAVTATRSGEGFTANLNDEILVDLAAPKVDQQLEDRFDDEFARGEDYTLSATDEGKVSVEFTSAGEAKAQAAAPGEFEFTGYLNALDPLEGALNTARSTGLDAREAVVESVDIDLPSTEALTGAAVAGVAAPEPVSTGTGALVLGGLATAGVTASAAGNVISGGEVSVPDERDPFTDELEPGERLFAGRELPIRDPSAPLPGDLEVPAGEQLFATELDPLDAGGQFKSELPTPARSDVTDPFLQLTPQQIQRQVSEESDVGESSRNQGDDSAVPSEFIPDEKTTLGEESNTESTDAPSPGSYVSENQELPGKQGEAVIERDAFGNLVIPTTRTIGERAGNRLDRAESLPLEGEAAPRGVGSLLGGFEETKVRERLNRAQRSALFNQQTTAPRQRSWSIQDVLQTPRATNRVGALVDVDARADAQLDQLLEQAQETRAQATQTGDQMLAEDTSTPTESVGYVFEYETRYGTGAGVGPPGSKARRPRFNDGDDKRGGDDRTPFALAAEYRLALPGNPDEVLEALGDSDDDLEVF